MGNFILGSVNHIVKNDKISNNILKIRQLDIFLDNEINDNSFDFRLKGDDTLVYKKITDESSLPEVKDRELRFRGSTLNLMYDNRNRTVLLNNIDEFGFYKSGNLIFMKLILGETEIIRAISNMSYSI